MKTDIEGIIETTQLVRKIDVVKIIEHTKFIRRPILKQYLLLKMKNLENVKCNINRHGYWIQEWDIYDGMEWVCSECGGFKPERGAIYCTYCGAKMDGER